MPLSTNPSDETIDHGPTPRPETAATGGVVGVQPGHVLETLTRSIGLIPRVLLPETVPDEIGLAATQPSTDEMPTFKERSDRYQLFGEIARGGMGAVLKGRDPDLGRDLAVKVLLESLGGEPALVRRFVEEAQICGQLQHPGIVPVYELGVFTDSRPYFTMKLVRGRTLSALLKERQSAGHDLPRFLSIFEAICQTVAYAHVRGVIHRDLKPSNVMVGSFGEVQVMDWGLAKVLIEGGFPGEPWIEPAHVESLVATVRSGSNTDDSHAGTVLGTPPYMSPEQAAGDITRVDRRADVFSLGSILCEILTGAPAYSTGTSSLDILRKAAAGNTAEALARLEACGAEAELIALAKNCLEVDRDDRPRDANVVAERITAYLASVQERVQAAERERAVAVAKAIEERRRRKLQVGLAASLLALTTAGGLGTTYYLQQRQARAAAVGQVLTRASLLRDQAREHADDQGRWRIALAAIDQAESALRGDALALSRLGALRDEAQSGARAADRDRRLLDRLIDIRSAKADDPDGSSTDFDYAEALRGADLDIVALPPAEAAARIKGRPPAVAAALVSALDDWASVRRSVRGDKVGARRLSETIGGADPDPWRNALRTALDQPDRAARLATLKGLVKDARIDELGPVSLDLLGSALDAAGDRAAAEAVLRAAQRRHPDDVWVNYNLARVLEALGRTDEAVRYFTAARSIRPETAHTLAHALENRGESDEAIEVFRQLCLIRARNGRHLGCFGRALSARGRSEESGKILDSAIAALREEIQLHPNRLDAHINLGYALEAQGKHDEAIAEYRTVIKLNPNHFTAHANLGSALGAQGKHDEAIAEYRTAIKLKPDDPTAHKNLGGVLDQQGKLDEAIAELRTAIKLKPDFAAAHSNLGAALGDSGDLRGALAELRDAIRLKPDHAGAHYNFGNALRGSGDLRGAIAAYREAIRLKPDFFEAHTNLGHALLGSRDVRGAIAEFREAIRLKPDLANAHSNLGNALRGSGDLRGAIAACREAIHLKPDAAEAHTNLGTALLDSGDVRGAIAAHREAIRLKPDLANAHSNLGNALSASGDVRGAIAACREAIRLKPDAAEAHTSLGTALGGSGDVRGAITEFREAIRLKPDLPEAHSNLGNALRGSGDLRGAIAAYREAIRLKPDDALAHYNVGNALVGSGDVRGAIAELREAIRLKPDLPEAHCNLGHALQGQGRYAESLAEFRLGHELGSKRADWRYPSAAWVALAERIAALAERLPAVLAGTARPADAAERLAFAKMAYNTKRYAGAAEFWSEALAADPKLGDDRRVQHRYNASCAAVLAAAGKGEDEPPPDDATKVKLHRQALDWLRAEYTAWARLLESGGPDARPLITETLRHWKQDPDLAGIRDAEALARLPDAERKEWQALWADVESLQSRAAKPIPTDTKTSRTRPLR